MLMCYQNAFCCFIMVFVLVMLCNGLKMCSCLFVIVNPLLIINLRNLPVSFQSSQNLIRNFCVCLSLWAHKLYFHFFNQGIHADNFLEAFSSPHFLAYLPTTPIKETAPSFALIPIAAAFNNGYYLMPFWAPVCNSWFFLIVNEFMM